MEKEKTKTNDDFSHEVTIDNLPDEVLDYILALVSTYGDLKNCYRVSRRWRIVVLRVVHNRALALVKATPEMKLVWSSCSCQGSGQQITKRYSHSAIYDDVTMSMFVFGGCTSTSTTFNDLWRLDLATRTWQRPFAKGSYPSPKACSILVRYVHASQNEGESSSRETRTSLYLFGGWTHPSPYPLHQSWKLFNELHRYDIEENCWVQITPASSAKPPPMAGHSATVHGSSMIVFGGLHKQRSSIGQFSSSNEIWRFDIESNCWSLEEVPEPKPQPRYGQSQLYLDDFHLLILGGSGGPSNTFNDVWVLSMKPGEWRWTECTVKNAEAFGALHMWCHPACRIGNYAVILGKNRTPKPVTSPQVVSNAYREARWNVIPPLHRGLNRGYGAIRRPHNPSNVRSHADQLRGEAVQRRSQSLDEEVLLVRPKHELAAAVGLNTSSENMSVSSDTEDLPDDDASMDIAVEPVNSPRQDEAGPSSAVYRSSVTLEINPTESKPSPTPAEGTRPPIHVEPLPVPRLQAFATTASSRVQLSALSKKQLETRQKQLDSLRRIEERYRNMAAVSRAAAPSIEPPTSHQNVAVSAEKSKSQNLSLQLPGVSGSQAITKGQCSCQRLAMFVLDISRALDPDPEVEWLPFRSNASLSAPEETILYTLVAGRCELIMFGGIQKDVSSITSGRNQTSGEEETVFNDVYFLSPPIQIV